MNQHINQPDANDFLLISQLTDISKFPVTFFYNDKLYNKIPEEWIIKITESGNEFTVLARDSATGLSVRAILAKYSDFPVAEWIIWFENESDKDTPAIKDIRLSLDMPILDPLLWHCNGDFGDPSGYTPVVSSLESGKTLTFAPMNGWPCDSAFPYYRLIGKNCGYTIAVGWPGQWETSFTATDKKVNITTGQQHTNLILHPGEKIRTPRLTIMAFEGEEFRAINLWRRWYIKDIMPHPDGKRIEPMLACLNNGGGEEFTFSTEQNQLEAIDRIRDLDIDFDVWWIDAGWYNCDYPKYKSNNGRFWPKTGTWEPDLERYPRGMRSISEKAGQTGAKLLVWFLPEGVAADTELAIEHPDWMLHRNVEVKDYNNIWDYFWKDYYLLDIGNEDCYKWITERICNLIKENGIGIYRQDMGSAPQYYWPLSDSGERHGMTENLHVQAYLRFYDELIERNPGLIIDSCASGGRRNDLETMRRSIPLHYSDYGYGNHPVKTAFRHTLQQWIPYIKECTMSSDNAVLYPEPGKSLLDEFSYFCGFGPMTLLTDDLTSENYDTDKLKLFIGIWKRIAYTLTYGDYYPLTEFDNRNTSWTVWQFNDNENPSGFIQGIRQAACELPILTVHPFGFSTDADYEFEHSLTGHKQIISGKSLCRNGFTFSLDKRESEIWYYREIAPVTTLMHLDQ